MVTINDLYMSDNWYALDKLIEIIHLIDFDQALSNCATAYKFNVDTDYFLEAHINISAIIHSIESREDFINKPDISSRVYNSIDILNILENSKALNI